MIYLNLLWTFFKIGLFTIGGGQAMIPMIMRDVVANGWLSENQLVDFIAISECTPGAFAINIATYTGTQMAGIPGAICATLGVVLPSLIIITLVVKLLSKFIQKDPVQEVFAGVRATVTGLLLAVFVGLFLSIILGMSDVYYKGEISFDHIGLVLFAILLGISFIKIKGKQIKPILLILISAVAGILCYGFIPV